MRQIKRRSSGGSGRHSEEFVQSLETSQPGLLSPYTPSSQRPAATPGVPHEEIESVDDSGALL